MLIQCITFFKIHCITCITLNYCLILETLPSSHKIPKKFVSSLVPRFQILSRKQLSIKLLDNKFQKTQYLLKTDLILLTVLNFLELPVLYDSVSHE